MRPEKTLEIYLDENHHRNEKICNALAAAGVAFHRAGDYFPAGTPDTEWLPRVGEEGWTLLTTDKRIRYRPAEKAAILQFTICVFCFTSNNLTADQMRSSLEKAIPRMRRIVEQQNPPFIATISETGNVELREVFSANANIAHS